MNDQYRSVFISFCLIAGFMLIETLGGILTNSLALLSDAGHMLSDAAALGATLLAFRIGNKQANKEKTFGYKRFEILVAGANGATLIIIAIMIIYEAIGRFNSPPEVASAGMLIIAVIGMLINIVVAWMLHSGGAGHGHIGHNHSHDHDHNHSHDHDHNHHHNDTQPKLEKNLNIHSAYLHVLGDLLGSVAAIIAALTMMWMGWWWADPLASVVVALLILVSGYRVVKASTHILMEGAPSEISIDNVRQTIVENDLVISVHDLHVWTITSGLHALSCHVVVDGDIPISQASALIDELEKRLEDLGISHTTIQVESIDHPHNRLDAIVCGIDEHNVSDSTNHHIGHDVGHHH